MKKLLSIVLTFTMILSIFSFFSMNATAQKIDDVVSDKVQETQVVDETDGLYVKTGDVYYKAEKGQIFTYQHTISIDSSRKITGIDGNLYYDTEGLDFKPYYDEYGDEDVVKHFPRIKNNVVNNFLRDGEIIYTFSNINGIRFDNNAVVFEGQFEVTADSGIYEINSVIRTMADTDRVVLVHQNEKFEEYNEKQVITDLSADEEMTDAPVTEPTENKITVYFVDSLRWNESASIFAHAFSGIEGTDDYVENASWPGCVMARTAMKSPDGANVYKAYIYQKYENIYFSIAHPRTETTDIRADQYFDNATNKWYENLSDVPAYTPEQSETPTQKPSEKPDDEYDNVEGLYIKTDGVCYKAEKGQKFTYQYRISVDSSRKVAGFVTEMYYDTEGLDFEPYYDEYGDVCYYKHFPTIPGGLVYNFNIDGAIFYNYANYRGVVLDNNSVVFTGQFEVTADSGVYEITTLMTSLGDSDMATIIHNSVLYDGYEDSEIITDLSVADIQDTSTENKEDNKIIIYYVDSVNLNSEVPVFAYAYKGEKGSDDYIENALIPGEYMVSVAEKSPDGVRVRKLYLDKNLEKVRFQYASRPMTDEITIEPYKYYDNGTNKWYENLSDIPTYVPTQPPTEIATEPIETPTQKPATEFVDKDVVESTEVDSSYEDGCMPEVYPTEAYEPTDSPYDEPIELQPSSTEPPGLHYAPGASYGKPTQPDNASDALTSEYQIGDVNRDGKINIFDATAIQRNAAYYLQLADENNHLADTNFDGNVNILDATEIMRYVAGYITKFEKK